ncbi:MAG: formyltransferase family protein [Betaproteobacteria bacterium]|nr:formyltransferase family protein [Betaproteobacteria bacterium]MDH3435825.1 formyltransferase family protein [Betaproteobacteria bacterium]
MNARVRSVLFLGKANDAHTGRAIEFCRLNFAAVSAHVGKWGEPLPSGARAWTGDCIISYLGRWIVPGDLLKRGGTAINFHPGPPEYPGYGCNNFAIYDDAREYGVTCHHMALRVDTGAIIDVRRFPVFSSDNAGTLLARTYDYQLALFYDIVARMIRGEPLPLSGERWTREPFTRKQFSELGRMTADMTEQEVARRKRATAVGALKPAP